MSTSGLKCDFITYAVDPVSKRLIAENEALRVILKVGYSGLLGSCGVLAIKSGLWRGKRPHAPSIGSQYSADEDRQGIYSTEQSFIYNLLYS
jgi:hypothetical protein